MESHPPANRPATFESNFFDVDELAFDIDSSALLSAMDDIASSGVLVNAIEDVLDSTIDTGDSILSPDNSPSTDLLINSTPESPIFATSADGVCVHILGDEDGRTFETGQDETGTEFLTPKMNRNIDGQGQLLLHEDSSRPSSPDSEEVERLLASLDDPSRLAGTLDSSAMAVQVGLPEDAPSWLVAQRLEMFSEVQGGFILSS